VSLNPGSRVGPYEVTVRIGAGGMGEVYRARDTRLKRDVALKVLPRDFASDHQRIARFQREAELLASLNHPNIAQIYGIDESNGTAAALIMEMVEGEDLAQRLARGPIPSDEALPIARQIAEALEAAHDAGVIHRDLKPANVKVRPDGTVKVLDFGLAKAHDAAPVDAPDLANSPTLTSPAYATRGVILGTAAYMPPEQAKGKPVDRRADIWSFGCVLFEMLAGKRAFGGEDVTDTLVAVVSKPPDWAALPATVPAGVTTLLRRCLEKNPLKRLPHIAAARFELDDALVPPAPSIAALGRRAALPKWQWLLRAAAAAALLLSTGVGIGLWWARRNVQPSADPTYQSTLLIAENLNNRAPSQRFALSPDGRRLAFVAMVGRGGRPSLWIRELNGLSARELEGTEAATGPFWSPDSRIVAFFTGRELKKIDADGGGPPMKIANADELRGVGGGILGQSGTWSRDNVIVFTNGATLARVPARGGAVETLTTLDASAKETQHGFPFFLPDGSHFLYVAFSNFDPVATYAASIEEPGRVRVMDEGGNVQYASGALLFPRENALMAQAFDPSRRELSGEALVISDTLLPNLTGHRGGAFSVSQSGALVYEPIEPTATGGSVRLVWSTRSGTQIPIVSEPAVYRDLSLAPDGTRAVISPFNMRVQTDIWLLDLARGVPTRFTFDGNSYAAVWSPDSRSLIYNIRRNSGVDLFRKEAAGGGDSQVVFSDDSAKNPTSWSRDGRSLLYEAANDIWSLRLDGSNRASKIVGTPFSERWPQFSPDGRWIAYSSDESGRREIYVTTAAGIGRWQISNAGGNYPRWSRNSPEIFFHSPDNKIVAARIELHTDRIAVMSLTPLFEARAPDGFQRYFYDVAADGRFLLSVPTARATTDTQVNLILNWPALLKREK
jgi:Tol biopolymer transport system component/aminoglycoside phosphotransferase (APT) family kinase protein